MIDGSVEYKSPIVLKGKRGQKINVSAVFWSVVQEARLFEEHGESSMEQVEKAGLRLAGVLGHDELMPLIDMMHDHIPEDFEEALTECWQEIVDAYEAKNEG